MALSNRTRTSLAAVAEAVMPAGARFPAGGDATVRTLEAALERLPGAFSLGLASLARIADTLALRHGRTSIDSVPREQRLRLLEAWQNAPAYPARFAFKGMATALKAAHFGSAEVRALSGCRPMPERIDEPAPAWAEQIVDLDQAPADEELEVDVAIVGSGAGGAAAARQLTSRGLAVVILEAGGFYRRPDFVGSVLARSAPLYAAFGAQSTLGNTSILLPTGKAVGGTTVINSGTCLRAPPWALDDWNRLHCAPMSTQELEPWFRTVEAWLDVQPAKQPALGEPARIIARGAEALGLAHGPLPRNAPDCDGQGTCCFGCPTGAKRSVEISLLPAALKAGAMVYTHATVDKVVAGSGGGAEVVARAPGGRQLKVKARAVVIAAGSLRTPQLLRASGVRHGWLGKNLSIHPAAGAMALFPFDVKMDEAIPQGYGLEGLREQGILFEGASTPFEVTAMGLELLGAPLVDAMESHRRMLTYGFNIRDHSRGAVRAGPGGEPIITYNLGSKDVAQMRFGLRVLIDLLVRGGAERVFPPVYWAPIVPASVGSRALDAQELHASDLSLTAYHPLGTARMGLDCATSVVDMDLKVRGMPPVLVCDGSVLPSSIGSNPQVTIMALSARAADRLADRLA